MKERIEKTLLLLGQDPWYPGLETHKVVGTSGIFESYVDGANRVTWEWADGAGTIRLRNNCTHNVVDRSP